MHKIIRILMGWAFLCPFQAAFAVDFFSARSASLAGSGRAAPLMADSIYLNPSHNSFLKADYISSTYHAYHDPGDNDPKNKFWNLTALDGMSPLFQGALGYTAMPDRRFVHYGASRKVIDQWSVGVSGKYGYKGTSLGTVNEATLSTTAAILPWLQVAVVVDNLMQTADSKAWNLLREYGLGMKFKMENILAIYLDPTYVPQFNDKKWGYGMGGELKLFSDFYARFGKNLRAKQPQLQQYGNGYGYGFGWIGPRISADFSVYRTRAPTRIHDWLVSLTLVF